MPGELSPIVAVITGNARGLLASIGESKAALAELEGSAVTHGAGVESALGGVGTGAVGAESALRGTEGAAKDVGKAAESSRGNVGGLANILGLLPGPLGDVGGKTKELSHVAGEAGGALGGLGGAAEALTGPYGMAAAAVVAVGVVSLDAASKYESATNQIAAQEGISTKAAKQVGDAFLNTGMTTTFTGQQIAQAFAGVAGQAKTVEGHALTASQSLDLMRSSMDLAEASGTSLGSATKDTVKVIQSFGLNISQSPLVSDVLFNAARSTGQSVDGMAQSLARARSAMGSAAPSVQQMGGFLLDLTQHGETGRAAMSVMNSAFTGLINPSAKVTAEQKALGLSFINTKTGALDPLNQIIAEVAPKIAGMGNAQATATLKALGFGSSASKLVATIQAGPAAFNAATTAVDAHGSSAKAAETATKGLKETFEKVKASVDDVVVKLGEKLMPTVEQVGKTIARVANEIMQHWTGISQVIGIVVDIFTIDLKIFIDKIKAAFEIIVGVIDVFKGIFSGHWSEVWTGLKKVGEGAIKFVLAPFTVLWDTLNKIFKGAPERLLASLEGFGAGLLHWIMSAWDSVTSFVTGAFNGFIGFYTSLPGRVVSAVAGFGNDLVHWITSAWDSVTTFVTRAFVAYVEFWLDLPGRIITAVATLGSKLLSWITTAWNGIVDFVTFAFNVEVAFWMSLPNRIINAVSALGSRLLSWITTAWGNVTSFASFAISQFIGFWTSLPSRILNALGDAGSTLLKWGEDLIGGLVSGIGNAASAVGDAIKSVITDGLKSLNGWIGSIPVVGKPLESMLSKIGLADGGYFDSPTLAVIGEAGPEVVLPLGKPNRMSEILGSIPGGSGNGGGSFGGGGGTTAQPALVYQPTYNLPITGDVSPQTVNLIQTMLVQHDQELVRTLQAA